MKVISPNRPVFAERYNYCPFTRYIVSDWEAMMLQNEASHTQWAVSSFNPYERRYGGQDLNGKRLCIYRHTAWGDQLMVSCLPRYIKTLYPDSTIHFYCDPGVRSLWDGNIFIGGAAIPIPMPFDIARSYHYHAFFEGMLENDSEHDQNCCYDNFFAWVGFDPRTVSSQFKRPYICANLDDCRRAKEMGIDLKRRYMVYHLAPANKNRYYPPKQGMEFIRRFVRRFDDWVVYVVGTGHEYDSEVFKCCRQYPQKVFSLVNKVDNFRTLIPIVEGASLVVCPDSAIMHLAAAFDGVPVISLWGLFNPHDRVAYYTNHHALMSAGSCPHAPCHNHDFDLPRHLCKGAPAYRDDSEFCCALMEIEPDHIIRKAVEVIG